LQQVQPNEGQGVIDNLERISLLQKTPFVQMSAEEILLVLPTLCPTPPYLASNLDLFLFQVWGRLAEDMLDVLAEEQPEDAEQRLNGLLKRFLLTPFALYAPIAGSRGNLQRSEVRARFNRLMANDWDFCVPAFYRRMVTSTKKPDARTWNHYLDSLYNMGELGRCSARVFAQGFARSERICATADQVRKLTQCFPTARPVQIDEPVPLEPQVLAEHDDAEDIDDATLCEAKVDVPGLLQQIKSMPYLSAPGPLHERVDHLKRLAYNRNNTSDPTVVTLQKAEQALVDVFNLVHSGRATQDFIALFAATRLIAVPKHNADRLQDGSPDVRPVQAGSHLRKIVARRYKQKVRKQVDSVMGNVQLGESQDGLSKMVQIAVEAFNTMQQGEAMAFIDCSNAFNEISRKIGMSEIRRRFPALVPHLSLMYDHTSRTTFYGLKEGVQVLQQEEGSQQGCVFGGTLFNIATLDLYQRLDSVVKGTGEERDDRAFFKAYFDDGTMLASNRKMQEALSLMATEGQTIGCLVNAKKTVVFLGPCGGFSNAMEEVQRYVQLGLPVDNIRIHPSDVNQQWVGYKTKVAKRYGTRFLGGAIGSDAFKGAFYTNLISGLKEQAERLADVSNTKLRLELLTQCFARKIDYLYRCFPVDNHLEWLHKHFDTLTRRMLANLVLHVHGYQVHDRAWRQAQLPINRAGLGLRNASYVRDSAVIGGTLAALDFVEQAFPGHRERLARADADFADDDLRASMSATALSFAKAIKRYNDHMKKQVISSSGLVNNNNLGSDALLDPGEQGVRYFTTFVTQNILSTKASEVDAADFLASAICPIDVQALHGKMHPFLATKWLSVRPFPIKGLPTLTAEEMRVELLVWLSIPLTGTPIHGSRTPILFRRDARCNCIRENNFLGECCAHVFACGVEGSGSAIHTVCQSELDDNRRAAGIGGGKEKGADPDSGKRQGDVAFNGRVGRQTTQNEKILVDIAVTHPNSAKVRDTQTNTNVPPSLQYSKDNSFIAGNIRYKSKLSRAERICNQHGFDFLPFIFETTGAIHKEAQTFLSDLATRAAQRRVAEESNVDHESERILRRWKFRYSTIIRKAHARTILDRLESLKLHPQPMDSRRTLFTQQPLFD